MYEAAQEAAQRGFKVVRQEVGGQADEAFFVDGFAASVVVVPETVHDHRQADAVFAVRAQVDVKAEGGQRTLDVVGGAAVHRIFAAVVEFGPGFVAGLGEGLHVPPRPLAVTGDVLREEF